MAKWRQTIHERRLNTGLAASEIVRRELAAYALVSHQEISNMAGGGGDGDGAIEDINVTPLVDIMLCLMVIFIIAAAMVVAAPKAIDIDLPKAASEQKERPKTFAVLYGSKEELLFNGERVDWDTMRSRVRQAKRTMKRSKRSSLQTPSLPMARSCG